MKTLIRRRVLHCLPVSQKWDARLIWVKGLGMRIRRTSNRKTRRSFSHETVHILTRAPCMSGAYDGTASPLSTAYQRSCHSTTHWQIKKQMNVVRWQNMQIMVLLIRQNKLRFICLFIHSEWMNEFIHIHLFIHSSIHPPIHVIYLFVYL